VASRRGTCRLPFAAMVASVIADERFFSGVWLWLCTVSRLRAWKALDAATETCPVSSATMVTSILAGVR
jgi:hypothetical protein